MVCINNSAPLCSYECICTGYARFALFCKIVLGAKGLKTIYPTKFDAPVLIEEHVLMIILFTQTLTFTNTTA